HGIQFAPSGRNNGRRPPYEAGLGAPADERRLADFDDAALGAFRAFTAERRVALELPFSHHRALRRRKPLNAADSIALAKQLPQTIELRATHVLTDRVVRPIEVDEYLLAVGIAAWTRALALGRMDRRMRTLVRRAPLERRRVRLVTRTCEFLRAPTRGERQRD